MTLIKRIEIQDHFSVPESVSSTPVQSSTATNVVQASDQSLKQSPTINVVSSSNNESIQEILNCLKTNPDISLDEFLETYKGILLETDLKSIWNVYHEKNSTQELENYASSLLQKAANEANVHAITDLKAESAIYQEQSVNQSNDSVKNSSEQNTVTNTAEKASLISIDEYLSPEFNKLSRKQQFDKYMDSYLSKTDAKYSSLSEEEKVKYRSTKSKEFLGKVTTSDVIKDDAHATLAIERLNLLYISGKSLDDVKTKSITELKNEVFTDTNKAKRINQISDSIVSMLSDDEKKSCVDENGTLNNEKLLNSVIAKLAEKNGMTDSKDVETKLVKLYASHLGIDVTSKKIPVELIKKNVVKVLDTCSKTGKSIGEFMALTDDQKVEILNKPKSELIKSLKEQAVNENISYNDLLKKLKMSDDDIKKLEDERANLVNIALSDNDKKQLNILDEQLKSGKITTEQYKVKVSTILDGIDDDVKTKLLQDAKLIYKQKVIKQQLEKEALQEKTGETYNIYDPVESYENMAKAQFGDNWNVLDDKQRQNIIKSMVHEAFKDYCKAPAEKKEILKQNAYKACTNQEQVEYLMKLYGDTPESIKKYLTNKDQNATIATQTLVDNNSVGSCAEILYGLNGCQDLARSVLEVSADDNKNKSQSAIDTINELKTKDLMDVFTGSMNKNWDQSVIDKTRDYFGTTSKIPTANQATIMQSFSETANADQQLHYSQNTKGYTAAAMEGLAAAKVDESVKEQYHSNIKNYVQNSSDFTDEEKSRINTALETGKISEETLAKTEVPTESKANKTETKSENNQSKTEQAKTEQAKTEQTNTSKQNVSTANNTKAQQTINAQSSASNSKVTTNATTNATTNTTTNTTTNASTTTSSQQAPVVLSKAISSQYQQTIDNLAKETTLATLIEKLDTLPRLFEASNVKAETVEETEEDVQNVEETEDVKSAKETTDKVIETLLDKSTITETDTTTNEIQKRHIEDIGKIYDLVLDKFGVTGITILIEKCSSGSRSYMLEGIVGKLDNELLSTLFKTSNSNFKNILLRSFNSKIYDLVTSNKLDFSDLPSEAQKKILMNNIDSMSYEQFRQYFNQLDSADQGLLSYLWNRFGRDNKDHQLVLNTDGTYSTRASSTQNVLSQNVVTTDTPKVAKTLVKPAGTEIGNGVVIGNDGISRKAVETSGTISDNEEDVVYAEVGNTDSSMYSYTTGLSSNKGNFPLKGNPNKRMLKDLANEELDELNKKLYKNFNSIA